MPFKLQEMVEKLPNRSPYARINVIPMLDDERPKGYRISPDIGVNGFVHRASNIGFPFRIFREHAFLRHNHSKVFDNADVSVTEDMKSILAVGQGKEY